MVNCYLPCDAQQTAPVLYCAACRHEIYPSDFEDEGIRVFDGALIHEDCVGEYALKHCRAAARGERFEEEC